MTGSDEGQGHHQTKKDNRDGHVFFYRVSTSWVIWSCGCALSFINKHFINYYAPKYARRGRWWHNRFTQRLQSRHRSKLLFKLASFSFGEPFALNEILYRKWCGASRPRALAKEPGPDLSVVCIFTWTVDITRLRDVCGRFMHSFCRVYSEFEACGVLIWFNKVLIWKKVLVNKPFSSVTF